MSINYTKRRNELAARLLTGKFPEGFGFNMGQYLCRANMNGEPLPHCETSGCMAGLAVLMYGDDPIKSMGPEGRAEHSLLDEAARLLAIPSADTTALFFPDGIALYANETQAGRVFARYLLTGEIQWYRMYEPIRVGEREF